MHSFAVFLHSHLGAETVAVLEGIEGEGPKSWGAASTLARMAEVARTTETNIMSRIFQVN